MKLIPDDILMKLKAVTRRIEVAAAFDGIGNEDFNAATSVAKLAEISGMSERSLRDYFKSIVLSIMIKLSSTTNIHSNNTKVR